MTIREAIQNSVIKGESGTIGLPFPYLLRAFANILYVDAVMRAEKEIDIDVLVGMRSGLGLNEICQWLQLSGFVEWWLEQDATFWHGDDDEEIRTWYDLEDIANKWNEYADTLKGGRV